MKSRSDMVLKAAKEVAVKYIETNRLPLAKFSEAFNAIYAAVDQAVPPEEPAESG